MKGYPSFMESPSKQHFGTQSLRVNSDIDDLSSPWDELQERVLDLEDDPITDESQIIMELDETIKSIIRDGENMNDIQSEEFQTLSNQKFKKQGDRTENHFETPCKHHHSSMKKNTKNLVEERISTHLIPIKDNSKPQNKTESIQKDFHVRKAKELRRIQYVTGLKKGAGGNIKGNELVPRTKRVPSSSRKSSTKGRRRRSNSKFSASSKKLVSIPDSTQKEFTSARKRSRSRGTSYVQHLKSYEKKPRTPRRNSQDKVSRTTSKKAKDVLNTSKNTRKSRKNREKISSLANQLYSNPLITKKDKMGLIYQLESLLNSELQNMNVGKSQMMRTDPQEQHPIWINHDGQIYPAMLKCMNGFKLNQKDADLLEIREGDVVTIEVNETQATKKKELSSTAAANLPFKFCGDIKKPNLDESQIDADFVVDDHEGGRYLVQIYLRDEDNQDYIESPRRLELGQSN